MRLFVDVDDTLILWQPATLMTHSPEGEYFNQPYSINHKLLAGIKQFAEEHPEEIIVVWSGGGKQYAEYWIHELGLSRLCVPLDKDVRNIMSMVRDGDIVVDDIPVMRRTHDPFSWPEEKK